jgi:nucleoside-diphosphate-sugar epimerase
VKAAIIGGTRFIGRALVEDLLASGHDVLLIHRGAIDPDPFPELQHVHTDRTELQNARDALDAFGPEVLIDMVQFSRETAEHVLAALPGAFRRVVISSVDVYEQYGALNAGRATESVPVDETGPVRAQRYPYRGQVPGMDDYDKLDVEELYVAAGGTVCRLPMVYGERDYQRREEFVLRRVRAGRTQMPFGAGNWLSTMGYVRDIATGIRLAAERTDVAGEIFNLGEERSLTVEMWARAILAAAGSDLELARVPDAALPEDLDLTGAMGQHLLVDCGKSRRVLGCTEMEKNEAIERSVAWHLENPPKEPNEDFSADDEALKQAAAV